jgi:hypothetical protein
MFPDASRIGISQQRRHQPQTHNQEYLKGEGFIYVDGGSVTNGDKPADLTLTLSIDDLKAISQGKLGPMTAIMSGRLSLSDMGVVATFKARCWRCSPRCKRLPEHCELETKAKCSHIGRALPSPLNLGSRSGECEKEVSLGAAIKNFLLRRNYG